jgi:transcriptional regulator with GAF, ATPase, and Fis domain
VQAGRFRRDLYYRLNVFPIEVPPLRAHREDIIPLAEHFLALSCRAFGRADLAFDAEQKRMLASYDWPGNIRELSNVIERAAILSRNGRVKLEAALNVPREARDPEELSAGVILKEAELRGIERRNLLAALEKAEWRISGARGAAELLGVRPSTLRDRMKALGVQKKT